MDLVGIEPTTASMPWNGENHNLLTAKALIVGRVGKTAKIGVFCYQNATKTVLPICYQIDLAEG